MPDKLISNNAQVYLGAASAATADSDESVAADWAIDWRTDGYEPAAKGQARKWLSVTGTVIGWRRGLA